MALPFRPRSDGRRAFWTKFVPASLITVTVSGFVAWLAPSWPWPWLNLPVLGLLACGFGRATFLRDREHERIARTLEDRAFAFCTRCDHDLTGVQPGSPCPECGVPTSADRRSIWALHNAIIRRKHTSPAVTFAGDSFPALSAAFPTNFEPVQAMKRSYRESTVIVLGGVTAMIGTIVLMPTSEHLITLYLLFVFGLVGVGAAVVLRRRDRRLPVQELIVIANYAFCPECGASQAGLPREGACPRCRAVTKDQFRVARWQEVLGVYSPMRRT